LPGVELERRQVDEPEPPVMETGLQLVTISPVAGLVEFDKVTVLVKPF
jgi:hypothetical protein